MKSLLAMLLVASSATATGQVAPTRSGSSTQYSFGGQQVLDELAAFGKCYAATERKDSMALVSTRPGSVEELKTYKQLFRRPYQSCLGSVTRLSVSPFMVRGAVAEGMYHKRIAVPANLAVASAPTPEKVTNLSEAAICYAGRHREAVQSLVERTRPGTKEEFDAVMALSPTLSECIPPAASKTLQIDATMIRFRLAEALWRLGATPSQVNSVGAHQ